MGLQGEIYDGWNKRVFWSTCAHLRRRVRHSLASQSESLAPCERRLGASRQDRAPLRLAEAIFLRRTSELSLLLLRENHVPVIPISFRNRFLAFAPIIAGG